MEVVDPSLLECTLDKAKVSGFPAAVFAYVADEAPVSAARFGSWVRMAQAILEAEPWWGLPIRVAGRAGAGMAHCSKALYEEPSWALLLQFFEFYRQAGVARIHLKVGPSLPRWCLTG